MHREACRNSSFYAVLELNYKPKRMEEKISTPLVAFVVSDGAGRNDFEGGNHFEGHWKGVGPEIETKKVASKSFCVSAIGKLVILCT